MTILPKAIYRFNAIPLKISMAFFTELKLIILKFVWKRKGPQIAETILRKKNRAGGIIPPDCRLHYKAAISKQYGTGTKAQNRIETSEINPCTLVN